jgi:flagellar biogenesis protein FliO
MENKLLPASHEELLSAGAKESPSAADASSSANKPAAIPLSPPNHAQRIPLSSSNKSDAAAPPIKPSGIPSMTTVAGGLGIVLGVFLLIAWAIRRTSPQRHARLPDEAFEILGRAPLSGRQQVHLIRCGNKLLLVSVTPAGSETLTEIIDPPEVDRLAGLCRQSHPQSSTAAFRRIFEQMAPKRPVRGSLPRDEYEAYAAQGIEVSEGLGWEDNDV